MAVRETIQIGDPRLKAPNREITNVRDPIVQQVITDLVDTMYANGLIGMAAPQIGQNYQIYVTEPRETDARPKDQSDILRIYINPKITHLSEEESEIWEACGCVAHASIFAPVVRPKEVTIQATKPDGSLFRMKADGILGRVLQHEQDHMVGVEFTEKISDYRKIMSKESYIQFIKPLASTIVPCIITTKEESHVAQNN